MNDETTRRIKILVTKNPGDRRTVTVTSTYLSIAFSHAVIVPSPGFVTRIRHQDSSPGFTRIRPVKDGAPGNASADDRGRQAPETGPGAPSLEAQRTNRTMVSEPQTALD